MLRTVETDYSAGWKSARKSLPTALSWLEHGFDRGDHVGVQMFVQVGDDEPVRASTGLGAPGVVMTDDTIAILLCASKPMVAAALMRAVQEGLLSLTDRVDRHLPSMRGTSLGDVRLVDCVSHAVSGVDPAEQPSDLEFYVPLAEALDLVRKRVNRAPGGRTVQYMSWPFILTAAVLESVFGQPLADLMRQQVFLPLGMRDTWMGMPVETFDEYTAQNRLAVLYDCTGDVPRTVPIWAEEATRPEWALPTVGVRGPSAEIAKFYRALLTAREGSATDWLQPVSAWAMTARHRVGLPEADSTAMIDFGLGLEMESRHYDKVWMSYGPHNSLSTFGHKGMSCYLSFCDPVVRTVVTVFVNGQIEGMAHGRRMFQLAQKIYEDLDLV